LIGEGAALNEVLFLGFLAATAVIMITPGPSVALVTSHAIRHGPRVATFTLIGDALGTVVHIIIATIGLKVLIATADFVLPWMQFLGGLYLLYLSWQSIQDSRAPEEQRSLKAENFSALLSGFIACVSNPKAILFFMALFPGFIDPDLNILFQSMIYGVTFVFLDGLSIVLYAAGTVYFLKLRVFQRLNHDILSAVGMGAIGVFLVVKGIIEILW
jgi:homoserine/homoserine lactone efflux protein